MIASAAVIGVALRYRARWPLAVLAVTLLGIGGALLVDRESPALGFGCEIAAFTVASLRPPRMAGPAALITAAVLFGAEGTDFTGPITAPGELIVVVYTALAFALGTVARTQRAYVISLAERARRADEKREQEARTRVVEERVRITRAARRGGSSHRGHQCSCGPGASGDRPRRQHAGHLPGPRARGCANGAGGAGDRAGGAALERRD